MFKSIIKKPAHKPKSFNVNRVEANTTLCVISNERLKILTEINVYTSSKQVVKAQNSKLVVTRINQQDIVTYNETLI